ncbi:MAG: hypothetical protein ACJ72E_06485 [Marmoricola sp.]
MRRPRGALATLAGVVLLGTLSAGCGSAEPETFGVPSGLPSSTVVPLVALKAPGYRIELPTTPQPYQQHLGAPGRQVTVEGYKASDGGSGYFLVSEVPNPTGNPVDLATFVNVSVGAVGGTLRSSRAVSFHGHRGLEARYVVNLAGTDFTVFEVLLDSSGPLFQLQYTVGQKDLAQRPALFSEVLNTLVLH